MLWVTSQQSNTELQRMERFFFFSLLYSVRHLRCGTERASPTAPIGAVQIEMTLPQEGGDWWTWTYPCPSSKPWKSYKGSHREMKDFVEHKEIPRQKVQHKTLAKSKSWQPWLPWEFSWRKRRKIKHKKHGPKRQRKGFILVLSCPILQTFCSPKFYIILQHQQWNKKRLDLEKSCCSGKICPFPPLILSKQHRQGIIGTALPRSISY